MPRISAAHMLRGALEHQDARHHMARGERGGQRCISSAYDDYIKSVHEYSIVDCIATYASVHPPVQGSNACNGVDEQPRRRHAKENAQIAVKIE
jgi:hypothetical protein